MILTFRGSGHASSRKRNLPGPPRPGPGWRARLVPEDDVNATERPGAGNRRRWESRRYWKMEVGTERSGPTFLGDTESRTGAITCRENWKADRTCFRRKIIIFLMLLGDSYEFIVDEKYIWCHEWIWRNSCWNSRK